MAHISNDDALAAEQDARPADSRVQAWLAVREPLERQLEPLGQAVIAQLRLRPGEQVLDIGCGIGGTPSALADVVGPSGKVVGVDVLQAALDVMRADASVPPNISFIQGDAEVYPFAQASFDAAFSRFGVMFFSDPVAAFANVRRALRPGGRFGFVCWRELAENELDEFPLRAASAHLPGELVAAADASGHFSFADRHFLRDVLKRAGYVEIDIRPHDEDVRSGDLQAMVDVCSRFGSLGKLLREHPELQREAILALEQALRSRDGPDGPALRAATWIVIAHTRG